MIASLDVNSTRLVLVERLDRLARFLTVQESILPDLKRKQFDLLSVTEPDLCSDDPTRTLMRQVLGAKDRDGNSQANAAQRIGLVDSARFPELSTIG